MARVGDKPARVRYRERDLSQVRRASMLAGRAKLTPEQLRENGRKGGIRAGEARRARRALLGPWEPRLRLAPAWMEREDVAALDRHAARLGLSRSALIGAIVREWMRRQPKGRRRKGA